MMYIVSKTMTVKRLRKLGYEIDANNEREMMSIVSRKWADEGQHHCKKLLFGSDVLLSID